MPVACVAAAAAALGAVGVVVDSRRFDSGRRIALNVSIGGVPVGGKTSERAAADVAAALAPLLQQRLRVSDGSRGWEATAAELGLRFEVTGAVRRAYAVGRSGSVFARLVQRRLPLGRSLDLPVERTVDPRTLDGWLGRLAPNVTVLPRDAVAYVADGAVNVRPGRPGVELDIEETRRRIAAALRDGSVEEVRLATTSRRPDVTAEHLEKFRMILSQYTTRFPAWQQSRSHNVRLAARALNGAVIAPGQVLSLNKRLGPRQPEFGYRKGPAFINGEIVPETGGGVCQVATTLYNAALRANLDIVERRHHSMPVKYVPPGLDATLYYGLIDLRLRNSLKHPVMVLAEGRRESLTVWIVGDASDKLDVQIIRGDVEPIPHGEKVVSDPDIPAGQRVVEREGRDGHRVTVKRIARRDGRLVREQRLHRDTYRPQDAVVRIGSFPAEATATQIGFRTTGQTSESESSAVQ